MVAIPVTRIHQRRNIIIPRPGSNVPAGKVDVFPSGETYVELTSADGARRELATTTAAGFGMWLYDGQGRLRLFCLVGDDGKLRVNEIDEKGDQRRLLPAPVAG